MEQEDPILSVLNEDQRKAVTWERGPLLVLAGAGSGKTRTIAHRIAFLIRHKAVSPKWIMALTFTNKAAQEMRSRVQSLLGMEDAPQWMGTFHATCLRFLRRFGERVGYKSDFVIFDDEDQEKLVKRVLDDMGLSKESHHRCMGFIQGLKNKGLLCVPEDLSIQDEVFAKVFDRYQRGLREAMAMDFGDLLCLAVKLLSENKDVREGLHSHFEHILVDEFQDTNHVQYELLKLMVGPQRNIFVVGDDDQSIYSWRGARVENMLEFPKDFPDAGRITLRSNYRSSAPILRAATKVISRNSYRHPKELVATRDVNVPVFLHTAENEHAEAMFVAKQALWWRGQKKPLNQMAVFYRTHAQSRVIEEALRAKRIPYRVVGGIRFFQRKEIKDVLAYLRLAVNPLDEISLERIVDVPSRGIGAKTMAKARKLKEESGGSLIECLAQVADKESPSLRKSVKDFIEMVMAIAEMAREKNVHEVLEEVLKRTGYMEFLQKYPSMEASERVGNVTELCLSAKEFVEAQAEALGEGSVASYLDKVSLMEPRDAGEGKDADAVNLMTVHQAKGLEFDMVIVCGVEEELFPHANSATKREIEEERRLLYVAMTRAKDLLILCRALERTRFRGPQPARPSRFIADLPVSDVKVV
jgi:DNA helicase-2/ATP-dependent DNA helicase PcrA